MKATFLLILISMIIGCTPEAAKEKYHIPYGFKGQVFIFFNITNGVEKKYQNGYRIYDIPTDGILKTQFKPNYGYQVVSEYVYVYIDGSGKETPLEVRDRYYKSTDSNEVFITAGSNGKYGVNDEYEYETFLVKSSDIQSKNLIQTNPYLMDSLLKKIGIK